MKLYELTSKRQELLDLIAAMDSEDLELSDAVGDTLEALDEAIQDKAEAVASFIFSLQADSAALKQEEQRLSERRRLNDAKVERMKTYLADMLQEADIDKVQGLKYTIGFRKSEKVAVANLDALPERFLRIKREPNLTALKEALKSGQAFDGVSLTTNKNLSIR